jgi:hypothetical protein
MVTATRFLTRPMPARARRHGATAPACRRATKTAVAIVAAIAAAWPATILNASGAGGREATPRLASFDSLARRPNVSWTARRWLEGELVDKQERGWMEVVTRFDPTRGLAHTVVSEGGSDRIRRRALSSVLDKEIETSGQDEARRAAFSSENYRYRVLESLWDDVRIELAPLRDDVRLLNGAATLDARSGDLLKVEGQLSRNPSFWVRDVRVSRTYARVGGVTLPVELVSTARVRMFGAARLRIRTQYLSVDGKPVEPQTVTSDGLRLASRN